MQRVLRNSAEDEQDGEIRIPKTNVQYVCT